MRKCSDSYSSRYNRNQVRLLHPALDRWCRLLCRWLAFDLVFVSYRIVSSFCTWAPSHHSPGRFYDRVDTFLLIILFLTDRAPSPKFVGISTILRFFHVYRVVLFFFSSSQQQVFAFGWRTELEKLKSLRKKHPNSNGAVFRDMAVKLSAHYTALFGPPLTMLYDNQRPLLVNMASN